MEFVNVVVDDGGESTKSWSYTSNDMNIPPEELPTPYQPETQSEVGPEPGADNHPDDLETDLTNDIQTDGNDPQQEFNPGNRPSHLQKDHPVENVIGDVSAGIRTRNKSRRNYVELAGYPCYTSMKKPKNVKEALQEKSGLKLCMMNQLSLKGIRFGN